MSDYHGLLCTHWGHWRELRYQALLRTPLTTGQVRIRVRHAGVGFAVSLFVAGKYQRKPPLPFTPGTEVAGEILEVGPGVSGWRPGDRVMAALDWGGFAEEVVTTAATVYPVPSRLALSAAAALPVTYGTVGAALMWRARLQPGETILIHGAGGSLGMAAVHTARLLGATVIATASSEAKRAAVLQNGAHHVLPADAASLPQAVKALCARGGVDVVFDPVGGDLFDASLRCAAVHARLLVIGFAAGRIPQVPTNLVLVKNLSVLGFNYGQYIGWGLTDERHRHESQVREVLSTLASAMACGDMPLPVTQHFPMAQWLAALDTTMERRSVGKVMLDL